MNEVVSVDDEPVLQSPAMVPAAEAVQQLVERTIRLAPRGQRSATALLAKTLTSRTVAVVGFMVMMIKKNGV